jgi:hypothetical protein
VGRRVSRERWEAIFKLRNSSEVDAVRSFLRSKLDRTRVQGFRTRETTVILEAANEDAIFTAGEWVRHGNPLGELLFYSVRGYDADGRMIFDSGCPVCREARREGRIRDVKHYAHRIAGKGEAKMKLLGTRPIEGGKVSLPEAVRDALKVREHDRVSFYQRYGRIVLDSAPSPH